MYRKDQEQERAAESKADRKKKSFLRKSLLPINKYSILNEDIEFYVIFDMYAMQPRFFAALIKTVGNGSSEALDLYNPYNSK